MMLPKKLQDKLDLRVSDQSIRQLGNPNDVVDFSSNDYLGFSKSKSIFEDSTNYLHDHNLTQNGATGSRLLTGNYSLYNEVEHQISKFHNAEAALIFNSGYNVNLGFFSSVPQRNDIILYDEFCHASIRDGIAMSKAKAYKFKHNNLEDLTTKIKRHHSKKILETEVSEVEIYIVTESVFSMDGDSPDVIEMVKLSKQSGAKLIVDEAHAVGVFGDKGEGLVSKLNLEDFVFARIITFGKAVGGHGAAILGSTTLRDYLVNFSRPFIYTTGLPPHTLATIKVAYDELVNSRQLVQDLGTTKIKALKALHRNIDFFKKETARLMLSHSHSAENPLQSDKFREEKFGFISSDSAIHCCIIAGNVRVKTVSEALKKAGFDVRAILSPTVAKGKERLRFCLHSYNSEADITKVLELLAIFVKDESNI